MLIKQKDSLQPTLDVLERFLALKNLSEKQRERLEEELSNIRVGARGEKEAAYHIDFTLKDTRNWAVIHDLRLEHNGRTAQVDHLVIGRMFDVFVIESKNVKTGLRVNQDNEFEVKTRWGWKGMASPVEQNKRHIKVLGDLLGDEKLTPTRLGFQIRPTFHNWVLVTPECNLSKKRAEDATILKMDMFDRKLEEHITGKTLGDVFTLAKVCSSETLMDFARKLTGFHRPPSFDHAAKFCITADQRYTPPIEKNTVATAPSSYGRTPASFEEAKCQNCEISVEPKVITFCRSNQSRFDGRILCRSCQTTALNGIKQDIVLVANCHQCGVGVEAKVVAFCRFNSRRFGRQILCRECQAVAAIPAS